jgi:cholesterol transport system auxiliary component
MKPPTPTFLPRRSCRRAFAAIAFVAAAVVLASWSLSRPAPVKRTFLLEPAMPAVAAAPKPTSVRVGIVNVAAAFRGKTFVYRESELKYDADYYDEFFVAPAIMLSEATAKALGAANVFRRVVPFGAAADDGDYVLDGFVSELYGDARNPAAPVAVVTVAFYLSPTNVAGPGVVWSREYRQRVAVSGSRPEAMAKGWNTAVSTVLAELARDLAAAELPAK